MTKSNKENFILQSKKDCEPRISNILVDLVNFSDIESDIISWGRGKGYGTMTFKCKTEDYGILPLFHLTSHGNIKFPLNLLRTKIAKKEIINDFQLKLESNFMMYFDEDVCPSDIFYTIDDLFLMKAEVDKFIFTIKGISARLHQ
jgi:hypothetical protein